jgi:hypothetical protein
MNDVASLLNHSTVQIIHSRLQGRFSANLVISCEIDSKVRGRWSGAAGG